MDIPTISAEELLQRIDDEETTIVYVSSPDAFKNFRIRNAIWIPLNRIEDHDFSELRKEKTTVVYCKDYSCMSSDRAVEILRSCGYKAVAYKGGAKEWRELSYPSESDSNVC